MTSKNWIEIFPGSEKYKFHVRYSCKGQFSLTEENVSERVAHLIQQAIEYGKDLRSEEIRKLLNL